MTSSDASASTSWLDELRRYADVLILPKNTFRVIEKDPTWLVPLAAYAFVLAIAAVIQQPSVDNVTMEFVRTKSPQIAQGLTPTPILVSVLTSWAGALVSLLLSTWLYLFIAIVVGKGWDFGRAWSLSVYSSAIVGLTALVNSGLLAIRGPGQAHHFSDLFAIPALSVLTTDPRLATGLAIFNPLNIWYYIDVVFALIIVLSIPPRVAIATAAMLALGTGSIYFGIASVYGTL